MSTNGESIGGMTFNNHEFISGEGVEVVVIRREAAHVIAKVVTSSHGVNLDQGEEVRFATVKGSTALHLLSRRDGTTERLPWGTIEKDDPSGKRLTFGILRRKRNHP